MVASITVAVLAVLLFAHVETWTTYFWSRVLPLLGVAVCFAAVTGFALGPDRTASLFAIAWGTEQPNAWQAAVALCLVLAACSWLGAWW